YKGKRVSVMASGMGVPSIGIYSFELFNFYGVENIIRIGSAGAIDADLHLRDIVVGVGACTNTNYAHQFELPGTFAPIASYELVRKADDMARQLGIKNIKFGNLLSSDTFYDDSNGLAKWKKMKVLAVEMESVALYMNAARAGKKALCLCTISDCPFTGESCTAEER
ncbi:MAG: purine-nucleoside phosphorylase, partial [Clostridia bacterium]